MEGEEPPRAAKRRDTRSPDFRRHTVRRRCDAGALEEVEAADAGYMIAVVRAMGVPAEFRDVDLAVLQGMIAKQFQALLAEMPPELGTRPIYIGPTLKQYEKAAGISLKRAGGMRLCASGDSRCAEYISGY